MVLFADRATITRRDGLIVADSTLHSTFLPLKRALFLKCSLFLSIAYHNFLSDMTFNRGKYCHSEDRIFKINLLQNRDLYHSNEKEQIIFYYIKVLRYKIRFHTRE